MQSDGVFFMRWSRRAALSAIVSLLAACNPLAGPGARDIKLAAPTTPVVEPPAADANATIGTGNIRIAMILPLTQASGPSVVGASMRNAAQLAFAESGASDVSILIKDDRSTPAGAGAATQAALNEGAELILGPLFAGGVREASQISRAANRPMIAYSTDPSTAARGVYLLGFLVDGYVERVIDFAAQKGKKSIAALAPENDYGTLALGQFQQSAANHGLRVLTIERYKPGAYGESVKRIAAVKDQIDSLFIPEQADAMGGLSKDLVAAGVDTKRIQILGTGLWNDPRALKASSLQGAWFSAPENGGYNVFAQKYRAKFGSDPARIATLAYDSVTLAIALSRAQGGQRYSEAVLTNPSGFNGADGLFRLRPDGTSERGLSVLEIDNGSARVISPAPRSFSANGA